MINLVHHLDLLPVALHQPPPMKVVDKPTSEGEEAPPKTPDYVPTDDEVVIHESDFIHLTPDHGEVSTTPPSKRVFQSAGPRQRRERRSELEAKRQEQKRRKAREYERD